MNVTSTRQLGALLRFQTDSRWGSFWSLLMMPFAFGAGLLIDFYLSPNAGMYSLLSLNTLFLVLLLGFMVLAPEVFFSFSSASALSNLNVSTFLLTRAIDRKILYRSRAVMFYWMLLPIPFALYLISWAQPDLHITEQSTDLQQQCLNLLPGTRLSSNGPGNLARLYIPNGNILVGSWRVWIYLATALAVQPLLLCISSLKGRWSIGLGVFFVGMLILQFIGRFFAMDNWLFFAFVSHQVIFWGIGGLVFISGQFWCEGLFARMEQ